MNWLAHVFLSSLDIEVRLGNLLADIVKGRDRAAMSPAFLLGVRIHQVIDAFTDSHPVVHRSRTRIGDGYPHLTGVLMDVFYDHFLALDWDRYADEPLERFTARLYADIRAHPLPLPAEVQAAVDRMLSTDLLGSYRRLEGIETALRRVSKRLAERVGKDFNLASAVTELVANFDELRSDFAEFFPLLQAHVRQKETAEPIQGLGSPSSASQAGCARSEPEAQAREPAPS